MSTYKHSPSHIANISDPTSILFIITHQASANELGFEESRHHNLVHVAKDVMEGRIHVGGQATSSGAHHLWVHLLAGTSYVFCTHHIEAIVSNPVGPNRDGFSGDSYSSHLHAIRGAHLCIHAGRFILGVRDLDVAIGIHSHVSHPSAAVPADVDPLTATAAARLHDDVAVSFTAGT
jgi:hypothetical protein